MEQMDTGYTSILEIAVEIAAKANVNLFWSQLLKKFIIPLEIINKIRDELN